jgi:hypothetical protein
MKNLFLTIPFFVVFWSCGDASKKGAWTERDKELVQSEMKKLEDQDQDFIDCYSKKLEEHYESFAKANKDLEGCQKLAKECAENIHSD